MLNLSNKWFIWSKQSKLKDRYDIEERKALGENKFGQVFLFLERNQQKTIPKIVRLIPKAKIHDVQRFKQQMNQLRYVNHKNIVQLLELLEDEKNLYFIFEYCQGGSLYEKILLRFYLMQSEARYIFQQIIDSLNTAHRNSICQRDLRPESFHFFKKEITDLDLKLVDLGFQLIFVEDYLKKNNNQIVDTSRSGKLYYTAPEIFGGKLSEKSEIWAAGVILHVLLTGELPFSGKDEKEVYENIQNFQINIKVQGSAADLIKKILQPEQLRIQIFQIYKHEWMSKTFTNEEENLDINFQKLKSLTQNNFLQKIMRGIVADQVKNGIEENLGKIFETQDKNGGGVLKIEQLQKALENISDCEDIKKLLKYVQCDDGNIYYLDFLNQIMEKRVFVNEQRIFNTFKMFDLNNKNKISKDNLWEILRKFENYQNITKDYCSLLISEIDRDNDGEIEYLEFIDMFFKRS